MTQAILTASSWIQDAIIGFADLLKEWKQKRDRKALERRTMIELSRLSDHDLRDLGIGRSDITSIARGTFYDDRVSKAESNSNLKGWV